jgi:hypothetical protein
MQAKGDTNLVPLHLKLSSLEAEPLEVLVHAPGKEEFYTVRSQDSSLYTLTAVQNDPDVVALLTGALPVNDSCCCCCCCPMACCC